MCAAVEDLTDNCVYATAYGWRLDQEAMNFCNRHQLCLACVSTPLIYTNPFPQHLQTDLFLPFPTVCTPQPTVGVSTKKL